MSMTPLPDGLILVSKRDCPTCQLIEPILPMIVPEKGSLTIYSQDDPTFPTTVTDVIDDVQLKHSYHLDIEIVPTLIRVENGQEVERLTGWHKDQWQALTGITNLGAELPDYRPGCGSKNVEPGVSEKLALQFGDHQFMARRIEVPTLEDEMEACYQWGWSDGLPVVPPTPERVLRMLAGTKRDPQDVVGLISPNQAEATIEKIAINAVLAGCLPEYLPVVIAAVEAACVDAFAMHGVLATTYFVSPVIVVNGPITKAIGMNWGVNVLGQGNRANATIGRALQLIIRNIGGGKPGGIDRAALGNPGKYTFCFAEKEVDNPWESLATERGIVSGQSAVTLFAGDGVTAIADQTSRRPESLARTFAASLRNVYHPKAVQSTDAMLVIGPEHLRVFAQAGWSKTRLREELRALLHLPGHELVQGAGGIDMGIPEHLADQSWPKFRPDGLLIVHAGGGAGMFSAIIGGWPASGPEGSTPVTQTIVTK